MLITFVTGMLALIYHHTLTITPSVSRTLDVWFRGKRTTTTT